VFPENVLPNLVLPPLSICEFLHRGKRRWRVIARQGWGPVLRCKDGTRKIFRSKKAAEDYVGTAQVRVAKYSAGSGTFSDVEFGAFRMALGMVNGDCQKLLLAVQQYVQKVEDAPKSTPPRAEVIARHFLIQRTINGEIREKTLSQYRYEMRLFRKHFGKRLISDITKSDLQSWVRALKLAPKSKRNIIRTFKLLFDHAIKLELRTDNPTLGLELPRVNQAAPERLSATTCELLLETAVRIKSRFLAALVIGLFTGARPAEICRLDWKHISLDEDRINVPGDVGKTHQYRWMGISPLLRQWLEFPGIKTSATVIPRHDLETYERWRKQLLTAAGLTEWPHDALRHTHASFDYAIRGDFDSVAANLGNSPTISRKHYIAPATRKEAEQFLQLTPEKILRSLELKKQASTTPPSDPK